MSSSRPSALLRTLVFLVVTGAVGAGGWFYWQKAQKAPATAKAAAPKGAMLVTVAKVAKENFVLDLEGIGTVQAYESADISTNVTERITAIKFNDGDQVKKGTLLATLSDSEEQAMLASAKATLAEEEREIARLQNLVKDGAAPEARLAERRTLADIAKQKILEAEARLTDRLITAPFDGWLGLRRISVGALVSPGTVIASIDKIDVVKIDFAVPETYIGLVKPGTAILARAETARDHRFEGKLAHIDSRLDPVTRSVAARAEVPNPGLLLKPGMLVQVKLAVEPRLSIAVPERALVPVGARAYVFAVEGDTAKRIEVKTGRRKPGTIEILSGIDEGRSIVADGLVGLQDGAKVKVVGQYAGPVKAFNPEQSGNSTQE